MFSGDHFGKVTARVPLGSSINSALGQRSKVKVNSKSNILFGETEIDLSAVEQIVEWSQTRAIADSLIYLKDVCRDGRLTLGEAMKHMEERFDLIQGLDVLSERHYGNYARPRRFEIAAAINRLRTIAMNQHHLQQS